MMYTFTVPREKFDERAPDKQMIRQLISKHISIVGRMQKNMAYYKGMEFWKMRIAKINWCAIMQKIFLIRPAVISLGTQ